MQMIPKMIINAHWQTIDTRQGTKAAGQLFLPSPWPPPGGIVSHLSYRKKEKLLSWQRPQRGQFWKLISCNPNSCPCGKAVWPIFLMNSTVTFLCVFVWLSTVRAVTCFYLILMANLFLWSWPDLEELLKFLHAQKLGISCLLKNIFKAAG